MSSETSKFLKFGGATALILVSLAYLAYTGVQQNKSYYVTIKELRGMGDGAYTKKLRVAGNVQPGSIKRNGPKVDFVLVENDKMLNVAYSGTEPPPDTFKALQAKCASKYAPQQPGTPANGAPPAEPGKSMTQVTTPATTGMSN
jgi:cytochrome c-type biogenesis protein CcmE